MSKLEVDDLLKAVATTRLLTSEQLDETRRVGSLMDQTQPEQLAGWMQKQGWLTAWQAKALLQGRTDFFVGKYKLLEEIHEGGLGTTYRAWQPGLGRQVVVKVMSRKLFASPEAAAQLHKEVQAAAAVTHPNLMYIFDSEQIGGQFFLVNELIEGLDLTAWQKKHHPLPVAEVVECVKQAALALDKAHQHGLIHGNLKPTNVLVRVDSAGRCELAKVVNMGLGILSRDLAQLAEIDNADQTVASPDYISPEQAEDASVVDVRSDLFSLGCLAYRLLTGETPFGGRTATEKILARVKRDAPPVAKLRPDAASLDPVLSKLLARDPNYRYQTPRELLDALASFAAAPAAAPPSATAGARPTEKPADKPLSAKAPAPASASDEGELSLTTGDASPSAAGSSIRSSGSSLNVSRGAGDSVGKPAAKPADDDEELLLAPTDDAHLLGVPVAKSPASSAAPAGPAPSARPASLTPTGQAPVVKPVGSAAPAAPAVAPAHAGPSKALAHGGPTKAPAPAATDAGKSDADADLAPQAKAGEIAVLRPKEGEPGGPVNSVAFSPNGKFVLAGSAAAITLWDLKRGQPARRLPGHAGGVCAVTFAPLGRIAATSGWDGLVAIWDLQSGKKLKQLQGHTDGVSCVIFSHDGKYLLSAGRDKSLRLWDVRSGDVVRWLETTDWVRSISFTPDNRCALLSGGGDAKDFAVRLWDLSAQQELRCMLGHTGEVHRAALAAAGRGAISVSSDGSVRLWDVTTGAEVGMLFGHTGPVRDVAVTGDNRRAVTGSDDETVRVWDLAGRNEIARFQGHQGAVNAVAVSPNLKYAVTGGADASVRVWKLPD